MIYPDSRKTSGLRSTSIAYHLLRMKKPSPSRLTSRDHAAILIEVHAAPRLRAGDRVAFNHKKEKSPLRRTDSLDVSFLKLSEIAFEDWNSPEDEAAFREL